MKKFNYLKNTYNNFVDKYIGRINYTVEVLAVFNGENKIYTFSCLKDVDECVESFNDENYWNVRRIKKIRVFTYKYNKLIKHQPLMYQHDSISEMCKSKLFDCEFSYLKVDNSLINVERIEI